jgi:hypothetical protein
MLPFEVGAAVPVLHAFYHAPSIGLARKADEAEQVRCAVLDPRIGLPALVAADWNFTGADLVQRPGWADEDDFQDPYWTLYDHDPHRFGWPGRESVTWNPEFVHQCAVKVSDVGRLSWTVDRRPGMVLYHGGLRDAAAALNMPWSPTVGHWPGDAMGPRRVDTVRVSAEVVPALTECHVIEKPLADGTDPKAASDHLAFVAIFDPAKIEPRSSAHAA